MRFEFTFKDILTQKKITLWVELSTTIAEFCHGISDIINQELNLKKDAYDIEIVEAGHYDNVNGYAPELEIAIDEYYPTNATFEDIFKDRLNTTAFYIRRTKILNILEI